MVQKAIIYYQMRKNMKYNEVFTDNEKKSDLNL